MPNIVDLIEGYEDLENTGAIDSRALASLLSRNASATKLGTIIKNPAAATAAIRKMAASKAVHARQQAALLSAVMRHEAIHRADSRRRPTVLVNMFFSAVGAAGSSAIATVKTPYSGRNWAVTMLETFCTVSPDPGLLIAFNPGGVDLALSPTQASISYSAGAPQAGIPSATFGTLATVRTDPRVLFAPWTAKSMVFGPSDQFNVQVYNAGGAAASWFVLLKMISNPCGSEKYKMKAVSASHWSRVWGGLHLAG